MTVTIDTPDNQFGVVNAQKLLASMAAADTSVTVGLPPNVETLVIYGPGLGASTLPSCQGTTTLTEYTGVYVAGNLGGPGDLSILFDVSSAVDGEVTISFGSAPGSEWYVVADSGVRIFAGIVGRKDKDNRLLVVPTLPSTASEDHPPVELSLASMLDVTNGTALVAAPGSGSRIRVFTAFVNSTATSAFVALRSSVSAVQVVGLSSNGVTTSANVDCKPTGFVLPNGEGLNIVASTGNADGTVTYTVETV